MSYDDNEIDCDVLPVVTGIDSRLFYDRPEHFDDAPRGYVRTKTSPSTTKPEPLSGYTGPAGRLLKYLSVLGRREQAAEEEPTPYPTYGITDTAEAGELGLHLSMR